MRVSYPAWDGLVCVEMLVARVCVTFCAAMGRTFTAIYRHSDSWNSVREVGYCGNLGTLVSDALLFGQLAPCECSVAVDVRKWVLLMV